jgi:hypothetical protein
MSWDDADRPRLGALDIVSEDRAERVMDRVMDGLPPQARPSGWPRRLAGWLADLVPAPRYAMPMMSAALLGIVVGRYLQMADDSAAMTDLLTYTSWLSTGF